MAIINFNIRMNADLKKQFEAFCVDMGMTMTTAFNIILDRILQFDIFSDFHYNVSR